MTEQSSHAAGLAGRPRLSVVVIMFTSRQHLVRCLEALDAQRAAARAEVIVPHDESMTDPAELARRFPEMRFQGITGRRTPAELRARATALARAPIVAFLEDHCVPAAWWCETVLEAHRAGHAGVGGPVDKGMPPGRTADSALNWAVYLADYSRYMPPMPAGPAHSLTDCNVSYKRSALDDIRDVWSAELHENLVNDALSARGRSLWLDPNMIVFEQRDLDLRRALNDRFSFGRLYGSTRQAGTPAPRRILIGAAAILMPPVLVARVARNLLGRRRHRAQLLRCLPHLVLITSAWMLGEAVGYVTGAAGRSLAPSAP